MFDKFFFKIKNLNKHLIEAYVKCLFNNAYKFIIVYVVLSVVLDLCLMKLHLTEDSQKLTFTRNSESFQMMSEINGLFEYRSNESHFPHRLTDFGYFIDIIIKSKTNDTNLINQIVLDEYNTLMAHISNITIVHNANMYAYEDLCAKRLDKCSIEGGILRHKKFQDDLLNHTIHYQINDPRGAYMDTELNDGTGVEFLFGARKYRTEVFYRKEPNAKYYGDRYRITGVQVFRNRFDFAYDTDEAKLLAIQWMKEFVRQMEQQTPSTWKYIDIAYSTSHTIESEIEKYSKIDVNYLFVSLALMTISFLVYMWLDTHSLKVKLRHRLKASMLFSMRFYLPFVCLTQIVFTNTSMYGFMTLFNFEANQFLITIAFIVIVVCCNQCLLLYKNLNKIFDCILKEDDNMASLVVTQQLAANQFDKNFVMTECLRLTFEIILIPQMYSCLTGVVVYVTLMLTSCFDGIRIYCIYTSVALLFNFLSQLLAYCPCLVIYLRQQMDKIRFLAAKNQTEKLIEMQAKQTVRMDDGPFAKDIDTPHPKVIMGESIPPTALHNHEYESFFTNMLFGTRIKYVLLAIFTAYFILNLCLIQGHVSEMPIVKLMPHQSYLSKHMNLHRTMFELGPMLMIIFRKEVKFWNKVEYLRYKNFINQTKHLPGMNKHMELNWLKNLENSYGRVCYPRPELYFYEYFEFIRDDTIDKYDFNYETKHVSIMNGSTYLTLNDKQVEVNETATEQMNKTEYKLVANRLFVQFADFDGSSVQLNAYKGIKHLAYNVYNYTHDELMVYTSIGPYLEQIDELKSSFLVICMLTVECMLLAQFFYIFDLRLVYINALINTSLFASIMSIMYLLNVTLNIVSLMHFLMIPAIINEYFAYINYTYKFNEYYFKQKQMNLIKFIFKNFINTSSIYLCFCLISSFLLVFSETFNFQVLFKMFIALFLNLLVHLYLFYPLLLRCFLKFNASAAVYEPLSRCMRNVRCCCCYCLFCFKSADKTRIVDNNNN